MALLLVPAGASAVSPVLEFVVPGHSLPVSFTTESGAVTAEMAGFETLMDCTASHGEGEITGPRSTVSKYRLTGCTAGGQPCESPGANAEEIKTGPIDAELVYIDQARHEVGMLLNPGGGVYIAFECGGKSAEGQGPFLAPVSPINQEATSFTATLDQLDSVQTPDEYENEKGERLQAIPTGRREANKFVPTGVKAAFTVHPSVPVEIKAITAQAVEAEQHKEEVKKQEEAFQKQEETLKKQEETLKKQEQVLQQQEETLKKREEALKKAEEHAKQVGEEAKKHEEEANAQVAAAAKKHQEEEAAAKKKQEEAEKAKSQLARTLRECQKQPKKRRAQCVASAHKKYGAGAEKSGRHRGPPSGAFVFRG